MRCCIDQKGSRVCCPWKLGSDGEGEFDEGRGELMCGVDIQPELVVAAAKVLHKRMSGADHSGQAEPF